MKKENFEDLKAAMNAYYRTMDRVPGKPVEEVTGNRAFKPTREAIKAEMDAFRRENPTLRPVLLKAKYIESAVRHFTPVLFPRDPFFHEMGLRHARSWGLMPSWYSENMRRELFTEHPFLTDIRRHFLPLFDRRATGLGLCSIDSCFDPDHMVLDNALLFKYGANGLIRLAEESLAKFATGSEEADTVEAYISCLKSLIFAAERFGEEAKRQLKDMDSTGVGSENVASNPEREALAAIAETAGRIPAEPPKTFYEGLAMLLFTREAVGSLESNGVSSFGQVDLLLGKLYEDDLAAGRLTEEQARELLTIWMVHTDVKFDLLHNAWPETSTCVELGGCDRDGNPVANEVTRLLIEEHLSHELLNPKLNCRWCKGSPDWYLQLIGKGMLAGHNNFVLINDDVILPGLVSSGVELADARGYVNGGCQETMIPGGGHTEGAALYVSVPRILDLFLRPDGQGRSRFLSPIDKADDFEEFYSKFLATFRAFFSVMTDWRTTCETFLHEYYCYPLFSAMQKECLVSGKHLSRGGAKYNFSTVALTGLGTVADSLTALKTFVYDEKRFTLEEFNAILAANWEGYEDLRQEAIALPKYGHDEEVADGMAARLLEDFCQVIRPLKNQRGGSYLPSLFVYYYKNFCPALRATPDGRRRGDLINPGISPSQLRPARDALAPIKSVSRLDFTKTGGGNAVVDLTFPLSKQTTPKLFADYLKASMESGCPTLQPNVLSVEDLKDAKLHPERHQSLTVRISGLSALFVALMPDVQDEIISRYSYSI